MKFEYIGPNHIEFVDGRMVERPVNTYGGQNVLNGETVEFDGFFAEKALNNPNYRQVKPGRKPKLDADLVEAEIIE